MREALLVPGALPLLSGDELLMLLAGRAPYLAFFETFTILQMLDHVRRIRKGLTASQHGALAFTSRIYRARKKEVFQCHEQKTTLEAVVYKILA